MQPGIIVLYRWRLRLGHEAQFEEAWSIVTRALVEHGSLGSRLHSGDDGLWYSYAQWPSADARAAAFAQTLGVEAAHQAMQDAIAEHFPEIVLTPTIDHLVRTPLIPRVRFARPTTDITRAIFFWTQVIGLELLSHFENHDGFDGVILGNPDSQWELEVTRHSSGTPLPSPTVEDIVALYVKRVVADKITAELLQAGHLPYEHPNPYWKAMGASVHTDPDGYTLIVYPID